MASKAKIICPMMGGQECVEDGAIRNGELVKCRFWVTVQGKHPQTGEVVNNGDCAMCWMPVLLIENSQVNRETGAAVESFRNEMVKANESTQRAVAAMAGLTALQNGVSVSRSMLDQISYVESQASIPTMNSPTKERDLCG